MHLGIQQKLAISLSLFLIVVFGISCHWIVSYTTTLLSHNIQKQQFAMTELIARGIDDKLGTSLANFTQIALALPKDAFHNPAQAQAFLNTHRDLRTMFDEEIVLVDRDGFIIAETPFVAGRRGVKALWLLPFLKKVGDNGLPDISNPYVSAKSGTPAIAMAVPIDDKNNTLHGFLVGSLKLTKDYFFEEMMGYKIGNRGYLCLFNTDRVTVLHPDKTLIMKRGSRFRSDKLLERAIAGFEGSGETLNECGVAEIVSVKRLKMVDWIVAAIFPMQEVYTPIQALRNGIVATALVVTVISIIMVWILTSRITASLKSFTGQVCRIRENPRCGHEIHVTSKDEVGVLATSFNSLMQELVSTSQMLEKMSHTDHLTGLFNRRHLEIEAPRVVAASLRKKAFTAVLMLDIDHFKLINDTYGHQAGDAVLVHLAKILMLAVRPYDLVVRHGGEEFLLFLTVNGPEDAMEVAERIRSDIQNRPATYNGERIFMTASIGVHVFDKVSELHSAVARADVALYEAKRNGRNRICLAAAE